MARSSVCRWHVHICSSKFYYKYLNFRKHLVYLRETQTVHFKLIHNYVNIGAAMMYMLWYYHIRLIVILLYKTLLDKMRSEDNEQRCSSLYICILSAELHYWHLDTLEYVWLPEQFTSCRFRDQSEESWESWGHWWLLALLLRLPNQTKVNNRLTSNTWNFLLLGLIFNMIYCFREMIKYVYSLVNTPGACS